MRRLGRKDTADGKDIVGNEPGTFEPPIVKTDDTRLTRAIHYYTFHYSKRIEDIRDAVERYVDEHLDYFPARASETIRKVNKKFISVTDCAIAELINAGNTLPLEITERLHRRINITLAHLGAKTYTEEGVEEEDSDDDVASIVDRTRKAAGRYIGDIDLMIDMCEPGDTIDLYRFLTDKNVGGKVVVHVREYYCEIADELITAFNREDEDLVHGHRHMTDAELEQRSDLFSGIVEHCDRYIGNKVAQRKPRKTKTKSAAQKVKNAKYLQRYDDLQLVSIAPEAIIGAQQLWTYNVKKATVAVYNAVDRGGLQLVGTTVKNYDPDTAITKKLRKPAVILEHVRADGKVALRSLLNNIKAKEKVASGRINSDTILVRAIK